MSESSPLRGRDGESALIGRLLSAAAFTWTGDAPCGLSPGGLTHRQTKVSLVARR